MLNGSIRQQETANRAENASKEIIAKAPGASTTVLFVVSETFLVFLKFFVPLHRSFSIYL